MGNVVVWKPASTAMLSAYYLMRLFQEAGLPDGVINLVYGSGATIGDAALASPAPRRHPLHRLDARLQRHVAHGRRRTWSGYRNYPRIVGETGGKDFIVAHPSADVDALAAAIVRGSFEYQGQKCSAAVARLRAVEPLAGAARAAAGGGRDDQGRRRLRLRELHGRRDRRRRRSRRRRDAIDGGQGERRAPTSSSAAAIDDSRGYFVEPTVIETRDPNFRADARGALRPGRHHATSTTRSAGTRRSTSSTRQRRTGSPVPCSPRIAPRSTRRRRALRYAAGNFYVNDKPTGAVVGQQPFGGARASGTNDKAGSMWNLIRWVSPRTIKETFTPPHDYRYPFLES